jgi:hypothetical protein
VQRAEEMKCQPEAVLLSQREIREATGWSDWQVRRQLLEMEYLYATINGNGRPCIYSLARAEENGRDHLRGLTDVAELQQQLLAQASSL